MNVGRLSLDNLDKFGEYEALRYDGRDYTNRELLERAAALAGALQDRGVGKDDMLAVMMPNSPDVMAAFQAAWKLGAVIIPVTPQLGAPEIRYMLEDSGATYVMTSPELAGRLAQATDGLSGFRDLMVIGESEPASAIDISSAIEQSKGEIAADHLTDRAEDDLALLLYTSGTTGSPKGVILTHHNMLSNAQSVGKMNDDIEPFERGLHVLPLSHSYGVLMMNLGHLFGSKSAMLPFFEIQAVFQALQDYQVRRFSVVPTMLNYMLSYPERNKYDLSALQKVGSGGAALANEVRLEFERVFGCEVKEGYGMSECAPSATGYRTEEPYRPGSVGKAIPDVKVAIRNDDNQEVARGEWGEICIQGPNVMTGYWNKPEATAEALAGDWLHSGDIGYMDDDGFIFITDRKKDLIIKGGENISPREIEEAIYEHPAVGEVAVIGLPHDTYGEDICAVVALKPGQEASTGDIRARAAQQLTKFKVPARVVFVDDLPKSANGKILKRQLKDDLAK